MLGIYASEGLETREGVMPILWVCTFCLISMNSCSLLAVARPLESSLIMRVSFFCFSAEVGVLCRRRPYTHSRH